MDKKWTRTGLTMVMKDANGQIRQSFTNVVPDPQDDQIAAFGEILTMLTGKAFDSAIITTANTVTAAQTI